MTTENTPAPAAPDTIVLVHGLWVTPRSWEHCVEHLEGIVGELDRAPIIMGHSAGGFFTQVLLDHGYGAAGVAIDSAPPEGVRVTPVSQIRSLFPVLRNPANRHRAVGFTPEQFHYVFTNTLSREESDKVYERYHNTNAVTDYKEFPGRSHYTVGQDGWEEVADYALKWAEEKATQAAA